jgi:predicted acylesterase/phospholipase RssA
MLDDTVFRHIAPSETEPDPRGADPQWRTKRPPFESIALLLQGGGALGSYQAGVYEALAEADLHPDWVAGISIGAINAAIIAGNPPAERIGKLRAFWEQITTNPFLDWSLAAAGFGLKGELARTMRSGGFRKSSPVRSFIRRWTHLWGRSTTVP